MIFIKIYMLLIIYGYCDLIVCQCTIIFIIKIKWYTICSLNNPNGFELRDYAVKSDFFVIHSNTFFHTKR